MPQRCGKGAMRCECPHFFAKKKVRCGRYIFKRTIVRLNPKKVTKIFTLENLKTFLGFDQPFMYKNIYTLTFDSTQ